MLAYMVRACKCFGYHDHLQLILKLDLYFKFGDASSQALLNAFEDDWILAKIFTLLFLDISASSEQAWSAWSKDLLCGTQVMVVLRKTVGKASPSLPSRVANHSAGFRSSCQLFPPKVSEHAHCN